MGTITNPQIIFHKNAIINQTFLCFPLKIFPLNYFIKQKTLPSISHFVFLETVIYIFTLLH